jgi:protein-disulfide isomerase
MSSSQSRRRPQGRQNVSTKQILLVVGAALVAAALLIVLNSSLLRSVGVGTLDYPTGVTEDGHPYKGAPDAPLKLTLFSDYLCGHCAEFAGTLDAVSADYIKTGRLQVIFYNFAFLLPESVQSAMASLCALDQSPAAHWRYHDLLYASRDGGMVAYSDSRLKAYAREIGLDVTKFNQCFESKAKAAQVQSDLEAGRARGVEGTPTWYLNDRLEVGAMSESDLRQLFDEMLKK